MRVAIFLPFVRISFCTQMIGNCALECLMAVCEKSYCIWMDMHVNVLKNPLVYGLVHVIMQSAHVGALLRANRYNGRLTAGIWAYIFASESFQVLFRSLKMSVFQVFKCDL